MRYGIRKVGAVWFIYDSQTGLNLKTLYKSKQVCARKINEMNKESEK